MNRAATGPSRGNPARLHVVCAQNVSQTDRNAREPAEKLYAVRCRSPLLANYEDGRNRTRTCDLGYVTAAL